MDFSFVPGIITKNIHRKKPPHENGKGDFNLKFQHSGRQNILEFLVEFLHLIKADNYAGFYESLFYVQHPSVARIDEASFFTDPVPWSHT
jgi:hypothetical protein